MNETTNGLLTSPVTGGHEGHAAAGAAEEKKEEPLGRGHHSECQKELCLHCRQDTKTGGERNSAMRAEVCGQRGAQGGLSAREGIARRCVRPRARGEERRANR